MGYYGEEAGVIESCIGKQVRAMEMSDDKTELYLYFEDKTAVRLYMNGDCCSSSWIEHIQGVKQLLGGAIGAIGDIDMPEPTRWDEGYDTIQKYGLRIETNLGAMVLEYRNSSNGYYGGNIDWSLAVGEPLNVKFVTEDF